MNKPFLKNTIHIKFHTTLQKKEKPTEPFIKNQQIKIKTKFSKKTVIHFASLKKMPPSNLINSFKK